jgi:hypothetical protein
VTDDLPELDGIRGVSMVTKRIAKVGRAKKANISYADISSHMACYRRNYYDLVVFWDGKAYPCCSTFNRATPGISIGNAFETPLIDIWKKIDSSLMFRIMKNEGFDKIIEIIKKYDPELGRLIPTTNSSPGPCSYCNSVFSNTDNAARIAEIFSEYEADVIINHQDRLSAILGEGFVARLHQLLDTSAT